MKVRHMKNDSATTSFGFKTIRESAKAGMVADVFTKVAANYDTMNDVMSLGVHRIWKDMMIDWLAPRDSQHLLDVAGGTGDIAFRFLNRAPNSTAVIADMTPAMLDAGAARAAAKNLTDRADWVCADAMNLPFKDDTFDVYTMSFGIRNVTSITKTLTEAHRVLKIGGRLMILEFAHLSLPALQRAYDAYSFNVIPAMGQMIAKDRDSYQYLVESIRKFPKQDDFLETIRDCGFGCAKYRNLSFGIAALHSAWKI